LKLTPDTAFFVPQSQLDTDKLYMKKSSILSLPDKGQRKDAVFLYRFLIMGGFSG